MKLVGILRNMLPNLFRWGVISRWLIALCLWAISMQTLYPVLTPWPLYGAINTAVVSLCLLVLLTRLVARFSPGRQIWPLIAPVLNLVDVAALVFITGGVALYLNGVFGEPMSEPQYADVVAVSEHSTRLGSWWPAGRVQLVLRDQESSERFLIIDDLRLNTLLPGVAVPLLVHQGAFGIPWVELKSIHPDAQAMVTGLTARGIDDPLIVKWAIRQELREKRFDQAMKLAAGYFEQEPDDFYFAASLADAAVQNGKPAVGVQILEPFVKKYYNYQLYCSFASVLGRNQETVRSVDYMKAAAGIDPDGSDAYYMLGYAYKMQGQKELALATYTRLVQLQPHYAYLLQQPM